MTWRAEPNFAAVVASARRALILAFSHQGLAGVGFEFVFLANVGSIRERGGRRTKTAA